MYKDLKFVLYYGNKQVQKNTFVSLSTLVKYSVQIDAIKIIQRKSCVFFLNNITVLYEGVKNLFIKYYFKGI